MPTPTSSPLAQVTSLTLKPHPLIALLVALSGRPRGVPSQVELRGTGVRITARGGEERRVTLGEESAVEVTPRWLGVCVTLSGVGDAPARLEGLSASGGASLERYVRGARESLIAARLERERLERERLERERLERERLRRLYAELSPLLESLNLPALLSAYLTQRAFKALSARLTQAHLTCLSAASRGGALLPPPDDIAQAARLLAPLMSGAALTDERRRAHNAQVCARELKAHQALFDTIESHPLNAEQRAACVVDEVGTLVVAGAGTGKTSTLVGRCAYLLKSGRARPDQVLLLAYAKKASDELSARLKGKLGEGATQAMTFHKLGLSIISAVEGKRPSLAPFAEDELQRGRFFQAEQEALLVEEPAARASLIEFCARYVSEARSEFDFKTLKEYYNYLKSSKFVTMRGESVKSYGELLLANELTLNGVEYRYEQEFKHPTATAHHRAYQPDFYLPAHDLYIELYGLDRAGNPPPFMDQRAYLKGIEWKRALHAQCGTTCLELFSYQVGEGRLAEELWRQLKPHGVSPAPLSEPAALALLKESTLLDGLSDLLTDFTGLFKLSGRTLSELQKQARGPRAQAFLRLFERFFARYERRLRAQGWVDFEDMISTATRYVRDGRYTSPYTHLLIDEFQDISPARFELLRALLNQRPTHKMFCVGDDWQAIYRFSGGDVSLMTQLSRHIDSTERVDLTQTFRFNSALLSLTSAFVSRNPHLLKKSLKATEQVNEPRAEILYYSDRAGHPQHARLYACLNNIRSRARRDHGGEPKGAVSVFLLSRYHFNLERDQLSALKSSFPDLSIEHTTAHASKGREADYVIILALENQLFGFPNRKQDDPIIELVLPERERFADAEESRLFYVALTRARQRVYLLTSRDSPSDFVSTLKAYDQWVVEAPDGECAPSGATCPSCKTGTLEVKEGRRGSFASCTLYPTCAYSEPACERCGAGVMVSAGRAHRCSSPRCGHEVRSCPRCGTGKLLRTRGRTGDFWGCSNFRDQAITCRHTENI